MLLDGPAGVTAEVGKYIRSHPFGHYHNALHTTQVVCTPAELAIMQGDAQCSRMLLERGGVLATPDYTAAHLAAMLGHLQVMKIIIDRVAMDMTAQDKVCCHWCHTLPC